MPRFRKKPVEIDAVQWTGAASDELLALFPSGWRITVDGSLSDPKLAIHTREGTMFANVGDWIIRGVENELYPCAPSIFEKTYEPV